MKVEENESFFIIVKLHIINYIGKNSFRKYLFLILFIDIYREVKSQEKEGGGGGERRKYFFIY